MIDPVAMTDPDHAHPPVQTYAPAEVAPPCAYCGARGTVRPKSRQLTQKRRPKFGGTWLLITIFRLGFGFLFWLAAPRHKVTVGVDR